jgi:predicted mannosyl-3-phosphoglycerate phosphatase (HAD superfamily)
MDTPAQAASLLLPIGVVITLVGAGIAYGELRGKAEAAHRRLNELVRRIDEYEKKVDDKLDAIITGLNNLRVALNIRQEEDRKK